MGKAVLSQESSAGDHANPGSTDAGLLKAIHDGDEQSWAKFAEEYSPAIYVWCRRFDLQSSDARDVSQQVLLAVSRSIGSFSERDGQGSFRGWLFTITRNLVRNHLTRTLRGPRARGGTSIQIQLLQEPESVDEESLTLSQTSKTLKNSSIQELLETIREDFDDRTWKCFWLVAVDRVPAVEVAERFGMQPAAVRQAKYRVTKRLRRDLGELQNP